MKNKLLVSTVIALTLGVTQFSFGFEAGDWLLRAGVINVDPKSDNGTVGALVGVVGNGGIEVDDNTQLGLNVAYFVTDSIAVELLAATPFKHDINIGGVEAASTKHLPPTLMALWYPNTPTSALQPYVGAGINYTIFFEEDINTQTKSALSVSELNIDDSVGFSFEVGLDYEVSENLYVNGQVRYIDISTDADIDGAVKFDVDIDPVVYMIGLAYKL